MTGAASGVGEQQQLRTESVQFTQAVKFIPRNAMMSHVSDRLDNFWEAEHLGCESPSLCSSHRKCNDCRFRADNFTTDERKSVEFMMDSIRYDPNNKPRITISYPLKEEAHIQVRNYKQAFAVQKAHEKRVWKENLQEEYREEMNKMIEAGTVVELSQEEMDNWKGGVHYIAHFPVVKMSSTSTKVRIVSDSKMKNNMTGKSFNDLVKPVPNALSELLVVLLRWRSRPTALMYDLAKAYWSVGTTVVERHLRRFLYRDDPHSKFKTYAIDRNNFGDECAAMGLNIGMEETAI